MAVDMIARGLGKKAYDKANIIAQPSLNVVTTSKTIDSNDIGKSLLCSNALSIELTIPNDTTLVEDIGVEFSVMKYGAGTVTFVAGSGVTIKSLNSALSMTDQNTGVIACKTEANTWLLIGTLV